MGDPRKNRKTYSKPAKPWDKERLEAEAILVKEYGLTKKLEIYKMDALLRKFASQAKKSMSLTTKQAEIERKALMRKLNQLALVGNEAQLDDVLALELRNFLERRLQTIVFRKGLANTIKQARQFITHGHVRVGGKTITAPSYLVSKEDEANLTFIESSSLSNAEHPERPEQIFKLKESLKHPKKVHMEPKAEVAPVTEAPAEVAK